MDTNTAKLLDMLVDLYLRILEADKAQKKAKRVELGFENVSYGYSRSRSDFYETILDNGTIIKQFAQPDAHGGGRFFISKTDHLDGYMAEDESWTEDTIYELNSLFDLVVEQELNRPSGKAPTDGMAFEITTSVNLRIAI